MLLTTHLNACTHDDDDDDDDSLGSHNFCKSCIQGVVRSILPAAAAASSNPNDPNHQR